MKATPALEKRLQSTKQNSAAFLSQARERKRFWFDYRIEMELIGARLCRLRKEKGHSIESVARAIRMPKYRLCKIEHGMYPHFDLDDFHRLCEHYNITTTEILSVIPDGLFDDLEY